MEPDVKKRRYPVITLLLLLMVATILVVYLPTLSYPFHYDDRPVILEDPSLKVTGWGPDAWLSILGSSTRSERRPVAQISFVLTYRAFGLDPRGWRGVNVLIHLSSTLLLFIIGRSFFSQAGINHERVEWAALSGAALWGLHPLNTQAVTYIVQRMTSMMTLFFLLGIYFYLRARKAKGKMLVLHWSGCFVFFMLALGTKENAAVFPFTLLLLEIFLLGGWGSLRNLRPSILLAGAILCIGYGVLLGVLYVGGGEIGVGFSGREYTMGQRLLTQPRVLLLYLSLILFPLPGRMAIDRDPQFSVDLFTPWTTIPALIILGLVAAYAIRGLRSRSFFSLGALWFLGTIFLESSFLPLDLAYEHRIYLSSTVPALIMGLGITRFFNQPFLRNSEINDGVKDRVVSV